MTLAHAARLLADARTLDALAPIVRAAGVTGPPAPLPRAARAVLAAALDVGAALLRARVAAGPAPLHALLVEVDGPPLRDAAPRLARHLAAAAPDRLWLLALRHAGDGTCALVAWHAAARGTPRLVALHTHPAAVTPSDADTLRTLAARAAVAPAPLLVHAAWLDVLGRAALGARFYHTLHRTVGALADSLPPSVATGADRADLALLTATRLLFLAFLEAKGWLDGDRAFLTRHYDTTLQTGGRVHARLLRPLFFGTLNTPRRHRAPAARAFGRVPFLNGGLFAPTPLERRHRAALCSDASLGVLVHTLLAHHRFTAREDATTWSEAAVDPEMLGRAFESLMNARDRRTTGAFYTPRPLVEHATTEALRHALAAPGRPAALPLALVDALLAGTAVDPAHARSLGARLATLRLLDPACGSGAFLVHALERLADLLATCGDPRPLADRRQAVLTRSIFGVDVTPTAVWLCELRLWLSVVVEREVDDPHVVPPLPNLDHNVRVGDALAVTPGLEPLTRHGWGGAPWAAGSAAAHRPGDRSARHRSAHPRSAPHQPRPDAAGLVALRQRYVTLAGPRKLAAARRLDAAERACALAALDRALTALRHARADALSAARTRDLFGERHRPSAADRAQLAALRLAVRTLGARRRTLTGGGALPFGFAWHFADAASDGGFDLVLGNPPWVRPHALAPDTRATLRAHYACARAVPAAPGDAAPGPTPTGGPTGFGRQIDLAALFTERALALTRPGGVTALLLPTKLWRTLAGGPLRALVLRESTLLAIDDWSDAATTFDAAVYPSLLVTRRRPAAPDPVTTDAPPVTIRVHRDRTDHWHGRTTTVLPASALPLDAHAPTSPWLFLPRAVRDAFELLRAAGPPLARTALPRPILGVKCGVNEAFLVDLETDDDPGDRHDEPGALAHVRRGDRCGTIERALLRPVVRGEHLAARGDSASAGADRSPARSVEQLLWPYDPAGHPLAALPPHAARWLAPWRARLARRSDVRATTAGAIWWTLFRTEAAAADRPRVVWPDLARTPHPRVLPAGAPDVPLNSCYVAAFDTVADARAFAALLAAPPVGAWLAALAEPARGGYRRFLAWTVALLPIPRDWEAARAHLAPLGPDAPADHLAHVAARCYGVPLAALAPLLAHTHAPPPAIHAPAPSGPTPHRVRESAWATRPRTTVR